MSSNPPLPQATRRVPLSFDEKGEPGFDTVCSPKSFHARALGIVPPRHVIPVIFVPGTMGTNLRAKRAANSGQAAAWSPPNGVIASLGELKRRKSQPPALRQLQLSPTRTEVDDTGKIELPDTAYTLTKGEAQRRGWGQLHFDSYGNVLAKLERALNDQYEDAGKPGAKKMAVWNVAQTLTKEAPAQICVADQYCPEPEQIDVRQVWNAVKGSITPLTEDEFTRLDDFFYPVWAFGYNWLDSNEPAADGLLKRINEVLAWYDSTKYFMTQGKVILVTHSMGGIVARRAAQKDASKILGVVHSVQPVSGAPVLYRRFRAGVEVGSIFNFSGAGVATIIGWDAADITCVLANSPGALELLPTKNYPPGWLTVSQTFSKNTPAEAAPPLPLKDPYSEIYSKRVQDVWWGMVDETLIDPAKIVGTRNQTPFQAYLKLMKKAGAFHDTLGLYCHPNTYANYGSDHREVSFGGVHWSTNGYLYGDTRADLMKLRAKSWTMDGDTVLAADGRPITFKLVNKPSPKKDSEQDAGDGTVPSPSGASIANAAGARAVFRMTGFDHQGSYSHPDVFDNVIYCIGKIVQSAISAKDLPSKSVEKSCSK